MEELRSKARTMNLWERRACIMILWGSKREKTQMKDLKDNHLKKVLFVDNEIN